MHNAFLVDGFERQTNLEEEPPNFGLAQLHKLGADYGVSPLVFSDCVWSRQHGLCHGSHPLQVLRQVAPVAILHDEAQLVSARDKRVNVLADVAVTDPTHQEALLLGSLQRV